MDRHDADFDEQYQHDRNVRDDINHQHVLRSPRIAQGGEGRQPGDDFESSDPVTNTK
jgi:hypothetical protein